MKYDKSECMCVCVCVCVCVFVVFVNNGKWLLWIVYIS